METKNAIAQLIALNEERISGYQMASDNAKDNDFRIIFSRFSNQAKAFKAQLVNYASQWGEKTETLRDSFESMREPLQAGKRRSVLVICEAIENTTFNAYKSALDANHAPEITAMLRQQRYSTIECRDMIESMAKRSID